jgi:small subunit ribosomal protein S4
LPNQARPKARRSRALGIALTPKAAQILERKPYPPGEHGRGRKSNSNYKIQLQEKQRLRAQYNLGERQLKLAFDKVRRQKGQTGEALVADLETRLDALTLRAGFARTIYQARQFVSHGHITVDGKRVDIPSFRVKPGSVVAVHERSKNRTIFQEAAAGAFATEAPPYLEPALADLTARLVRTPARAEVPIICDEQLVVEFYSR